MASARHICHAVTPKLNPRISSVMPMLAQPLKHPASRAVMLSKQPPMFTSGGRTSIWVTCTCLAGSEARGSAVPQYPQAPASTMSGGNEAPQLPQRTVSPPQSVSDELRVGYHRGAQEGNLRTTISVAVTMTVMGCVAAKEAAIDSAMDQIWNRGETQIIDDNYQPELAHEVKRFVAENRALYPDLKVTIEDHVIAGNRYVTQWAVSGTHRDLGKPVTLRGVSMRTRTEGMFVQEEMFYDLKDVYDQLGFRVLPPDGVSPFDGVAAADRAAQPRAPRRPPKPGRAPCPTPIAPTR